MRNLFYCNTTYQLLVCINIVLMRTGSDENDIILSDRTDFTKTAENLREEGVFDHVTVIFPKALEAEEEKKGLGKWQRRLQHLKRYSHLEKWMSEEYDLMLTNYDAMYVCNMTDHAVMYVYSVLARKNKRLALCEIEDGFGTYVRPLRHAGSERSLNRLAFSVFGNPFLTEESISKSLLFFPDLYVHEDDVPKEQLPLMNLRDPEIQGLMQRVFGCEGTRLRKKYIIMEESFKAEGEINNSEQLFTEIVDMVGEENVMLKTHPRNGRNSYHERDIEVYDEPVAWEAIIATENLDDKVLVTCTSGTVVSTKLLYGSKCVIIYLYKLLEGDASSAFKSPYTIPYLERFHERYKDKVFVPATHEELREIVRKLEAKERKKNEQEGVH